MTEPSGISREFDEEDWLIVHLNGFASGREYERPRTRQQTEREIVAWLRKFGSHLVKDQSRALSSAADAIERREYRLPA